MTQANSCPICGEVFEKGTIIFTIDYERGSLVKTQKSCDFPRKTAKFNRAKSRVGRKILG